MKSKTKCRHLPAGAVKLVVAEADFSLFFQSLVVSANGGQVLPHSQLFSGTIHTSSPDAAQEHRLRMALAQLTNPPLDNIRGRHDTKWS